MARKHLDAFPEGVLRHISEIIGGYRTGSQIADLLVAAGYPERAAVQGTKWRYLYSTFLDFNQTSDDRYHIGKIVQTFCDPTEWIGNESARRKAVDSLNDGLAHVKLQVNEQGKLIVTEGNITHTATQRRQGTPAAPGQMTVAPLFKARDVKTEENLCFVLMPFGPAFDRLYRERIKPAVEYCGFHPLRADDLFSPTPILEDIWTYICASRVILADVTDRNPNVFYEIGIAHTVGKPVVVITQNQADVPFDIAHVRYFLYSDDKEGWCTLSGRIASALRSIREQT